VTSEGFVHLTIQSLKQRLDKDNKMVIQEREGTLSECEFIFNLPVNENALNDFRKSVRYDIPADYMEFLKQNNGCKLFYESDTGEGWSFLSLKDISDYISERPEFYKDQWIPIATSLDGILMIDSNLINSNDGYLLWSLEGIERPENSDNLKLNFELFFDRLVIANGTNFWEWSIYTAENYYKS
jgi:hypothetical protein